MVTHRKGRQLRKTLREQYRQPRLDTVRYGIKPISVISDDQLEDIHQRSLQLLQELGIEFRDDTALQQWRDAGATVKGSRVFIPAELIEQLIATIPARFTLTGRGVDSAFEMAVDTVSFCPAQGAPNIRDEQGNRRFSTLADLRKLNKVTQMSPGFHMATGFACEPTDIPVPWRHLYINYSNLVDTELAYFGLSTGEERAKDSVAMAELVYGKSFMQNNAVMIGHISGNSPLVWDSTMLEGLRVFAEANQVVLLSPFVLAAANTPAHIIATIIQVNAEALAALAYAQLVKPGTKCIYGQYSVSVSMQTGAPMSGMPEVNLINGIIGQLARRYNIPWRTTASQASSKTLDAQSGYESATSYMAGITANANFMLHAGGWDEAGMVQCINKLVIDGEQNLLMAKFAAGVNFDYLEEAMEAVYRVGPGGHYLGDSFTLKHFQDAFIRPELLNYEAYEHWQLNGGQDMNQRAANKVEKLLNEYQAPQLDSAIHESLLDYVKRRESEISPSLH